MDRHLAADLTQIDVKGFRQMRIVIFRSTEAKAPRTNAAKRDAVAERLAVARVKRPALADLFLSGAFYDLPVLDPAERTTPALRAHRGTADTKGWTLPLDEVGRTGRIDQSVANSVRLWVTKNLDAYVRPADLTVTVEDY